MYLETAIEGLELFVTAALPRVIVNSVLKRMKFEAVRVNAFWMNERL